MVRTRELLYKKWFFGLLGSGKAVIKGKNNWDAMNKSRSEKLSWTFGSSKKKKEKDKWSKR